MTTPFHRTAVSILSISLFLLLPMMLSAHTPPVPDTLSGEELETVRLRITTKSGVVKAYRFQVNGEKFGKWTVLSHEEPVAEFLTADKRADRVYLQYSLDGWRWSASTQLTYDEARERWVPVRPDRTGQGAAEDEGVRLSASLGGEFTIALSDMPETYYEKCAGAAAELSMAVAGNRNLLGSMKLHYRVGKPESALVGTAHELSLGAGIGYRVHVGFLGLQPDIGGGIIMHLIQNGDGRLLGVFADGYLDTGVRFSAKIADVMDLYARGGVQLFLEQDGDYGLLGTGLVGFSIAL